MGSEENFSSSDEALQAELRRLAVRVERLEQEVAILRAVPPVNAPAKTAVPAPPPPPRVTPVTPSQEASAVPRVELPSFGAHAQKSTTSLENRLGAQIFNRIGIVALLCAATLGLKLAIDNQWIGPVGRILIGLVAGAGVIVWSERFRRKGFAAFSYSLKAVGTGVLYLSLWAAFQLYHLLPSAAALAAMLFVTGWNAYMAWSQSAELLAAYALIGGLSTPLLLSTGGDHEVFLFTYLLAIDAATVALVRLRSWGRLLLAAFPATVVYYIGWYAAHYHEPAFAWTTSFVALFFLVFVAASVGERRDATGVGDGKRHLADAVREILLPLGNAAFVALALYALLRDSERYWFLPWMMLILASAYLAITRLPQRAVPAAMHLSLAVVFLTIAVPLKASGHWIMVSWLVEGVALLWVACRTAQSDDEERLRSSAILRWLSAGSFVLGLAALVGTDFWFGVGPAPSIFDHNAMTALVGVASLAGAAWLALRAREVTPSLWQDHSRFAVAALVGIGGVAVLLALREIATTAGSGAAHAAFSNAEFGMAMMGVAILAALAWSAMQLSLRDSRVLIWAPLSAGAVIAINLVAVLSGVREVRALWPVATADVELELRRSLAVSGFLMLYAAVLLAIGFWRRSSFVRWQALVLLVLSIAKTFLYDMRDLSQGYRFVSFLALGALLMAISYAYQKDWLALRDPHADAAPKDETRGAAQ